MHGSRDRHKLCQVLFIMAIFLIVEGRDAFAAEFISMGSEKSQIFSLKR
jgi:hypothetical protein